MQVQDVNLVLQIGLLVAIIVAVLYIKRIKINFHGAILLLSVIVNGISILIVMLPSAFRILEGASINSFSISVWLHTFTGLFVELIGLYIVLDWRLKSGACVRFKHYMRILAPLWFAVALVGFYMYVNLHI